MQKNAAKRYRLILSAVHMVYRLVNSTFTPKEFSLRLTRLLCQFIRASAASIYVLDPDKKNFAFVARYNNQINILLDKPKDLKEIPRDVVRISRGESVFNAQMIGLPLIADDYLGAIVVTRENIPEHFNEFDREMLSVFAEQAVTAIKNLQFRQQHEKVILGSIKSIGNFIKKQGRVGLTHPAAYTQVVTLLAQRLKVGQEGVKSLEYASLLHDIGIIDVPFDVLSKTESLTPKEFEMIRRHTAHSVALIKPVDFLKPVLPIILYHHEKYDGTGYPSGLKKEQIPLGARIISVVDAVEAMLKGRPYRAAMPLDNTIDELKRFSGTQFDPKVVDAFCALAAQKKFRKTLSLLKS